MKTYTLWGIIFSILLSINSPVHAASLPVSTSKIIPVEDIYKKIASLKVRDIQHLTGRKLTLKEKIAFLILKQKIKHRAGDNQNQGETAFIFGLVGLGLLIVGLFVPYVIFASLISAILAIVIGSMAKKQNPDDKKAHAAKLLGWITLALIAFFLILAAIIVAAIFSGFWG